MKKILVGLALIMTMLSGAMLSVGSAQALVNDNLCDDDHNIPEEMREAAGCNDFGSDKPTAVPRALNIINVVVSFVGVVAVGVIVYGGVLYATSVGDASKINKAKNCILYGVVGVVVSALAYAIVAFVNMSILKK